MIVDGQGHVVWFHQLQPPRSPANLRIQHYDGKPVLTWWQGPVTVAAYGLGEGVIADTRYRTLHVVHAGNGYAMDIHEFSLTPERRRAVHRLLAGAGAPARHAAGHADLAASTRSSRRSTCAPDS